MGCRMNRPGDIYRYIGPNESAQPHLFEITGPSPYEGDCRVRCLTGQFRDPDFRWMWGRDGHCPRRHLIPIRDPDQTQETKREAVA